MIDLRSHPALGRDRRRARGCGRHRGRRQLRLGLSAGRGAGRRRGPTPSPEPVWTPWSCRRSMHATWVRASGNSNRWQKLEAGPIRAGHKLVTGMRGSYGGVLMFGMLTSFAGLGMFNPLSLGAGLLLGRKAYKEDMENRMLRVRGEAKSQRAQVRRRCGVRGGQGIPRPAQGRPAPAARPLPRHRQPDQPLAQRVAAGHPRGGQDRGERAQHPRRRTGAAAQHPQAGHRATLDNSPRGPR
jgi:hypothetical protein